MATDRGVVEDWLSEFKVSPAASAVKGIVHPKTKILSLITHLHIVPSP